METGTRNYRLNPGVILGMGSPSRRPPSQFEADLWARTRTWTTSLISVALSLAACEREVSDCPFAPARLPPATPCLAPTMKPRTRSQTASGR